MYTRFTEIYSYNKNNFSTISMNLYIYGVGVGWTLYDYLEYRTVFNFKTSKYGRCVAII